VSMGRTTDIEEQYDKIYRYCYFKVHKQEVAEDITQETFLRFYEHYGHYGNDWTLQYLYKIAHNLCVDELRKREHEVITEENSEIGAVEGPENQVLTNLAVKEALATLSKEEQELILLRYVNEVPMGTIAKLYEISRFALYRKLKAATEKLQSQLGEEEFK